MNHIFKIVEISHLASDGSVIWSARDLLNTFHSSGEEFVLRAAFLGGKKNNAYIPVTYFFGLDNRTKVTVADTMQTIQSEPSDNGYRRATVPSFAQFEMQDKGGWVALSPALYFTATTKAWTEVRNVFVTDQSDASGYLIASVPLDKVYTLDAGQSLSLKVGIQLKGS